MSEPFDLVVIGLGSAGRSAAELGAALGARVAAVERDRPGGDCLWTGCIPSKALLASARVAHAVRTADRFGIAAAEPEIDLTAVWERIRRIQAGIATTDDDPDRLRSAGIEVVVGDARLVSPTTVRVGERTLETRHVLVATGSRPWLPDVPGMGDATPLTTDSLFELDRPPASLVVIGAGAVGVELAQALRRLGVAVTLLERAERVLPTEEPELAGRVGATLRAEGVDVNVSVEVTAVRRDDDSTTVEAMTPTGAQTWTAADVLLACGRSPVTDGLGLDELGVDRGPGGIVVDRRGRTSVPTVFAAGDVAGPHHLTHWAASAATVAVRAMLLRGPAAVEDVVPWCTFTDPELARVGLTVDQARAEHGDDVEVWRLDLAANDRARAEGADGAIVLVTAGRQRLVGAHVLAPGAGEVIGELALAIRDGRRLNHLAGLLHAYPTISSGVGTLAAEAVRTKAARIGAARISGRSSRDPGR